MPHLSRLTILFERFFGEAEPVPVGWPDRFVSPRSARQVIADLHRHVSAPLAPPTLRPGLFLKTFGHNQMQFAHGTTDEELFVGVVDIDASLVSRCAVQLTVLSRADSRGLAVLHGDIAQLRHRVHGAIAAGGGRAS